MIALPAAAQVSSISTDYIEPSGLIVVAHIAKVLEIGNGVVMMHLEPEEVLRGHHSGNDPIGVFLYASYGYSPGPRKFTFFLQRQGRGQRYRLLESFPIDSDAQDGEGAARLQVLRELLAVESSSMSTREKVAAMRSYHLGLLETSDVGWTQGNSMAELQWLLTRYPDSFAAADLEVLDAITDSSAREDGARSTRTRQLAALANRVRRALLLPVPTDRLALERGTAVQPSRTRTRPPAAIAGRPVRSPDDPPSAGDFDYGEEAGRGGYAALLPGLDAPAGLRRDAPEPEPAPPLERGAASLEDDDLPLPGADDEADLGGESLPGPWSLARERLTGEGASDDTSDFMDPSILFDDETGDEIPRWSDEGDSLPPPDAQGGGDEAEELADARGTRGAPLPEPTEDGHFGRMPSWSPAGGGAPVEGAPPPRPGVSRTSDEGGLDPYWLDEDSGLSSAELAARRLLGGSRARAEDDRGAEAGPARIARGEDYSVPPLPDRDEPSPTRRVVVGERGDGESEIPYWAEPDEPRAPERPALPRRERGVVPLGAVDLDDFFERFLDAPDPSQKAAMVAGLRDLEPGTYDGEAMAVVLRACIGEDSARVKEESVRTVEALGLRQVAPTVRAIARDGTESLGLRLDAIRALGRVHDKESITVLEALADSPLLTTEALTAIRRIGVEHREAIDTLESLRRRYSGNSGADRRRRKSIDTMLSPDWLAAERQLEEVRRSRE